MREPAQIGDERRDRARLDRTILLYAAAYPGTAPDAPGGRRRHIVPSLAGGSPRTNRPPSRSWRAN